MQHFPPSSTPLSAAQANAGHCCILFSEGPPAHLLQLAAALGVHRIGGCLVQELLLAFSATRRCLVLAHRPAQRKKRGCRSFASGCLLQQLSIVLAACSRLVLAHCPAQHRQQQEWMCGAQSADALVNAARSKLLCHPPPHNTSTTQPHLRSSNMSRWRPSSNCILRNTIITHDACDMMQPHLRSSDMSPCTLPRGSRCQLGFSAKRSGI